MASQAKAVKVDGMNSSGECCISEENIQETIEKIDEVQNQIDNLNEQASEEILQVEQKYNKLRLPHYEKRAQMISNIESFWVQTFLNHPQMSSLFTEEDEEILQHLTKVEVQECEDIKSGYKITFHFSPNKWLKNQSITKEFKMTENGEPFSKVTPIEWESGMDITQNKKRTNGDRKRDFNEANQDSFFCWFSDTKNMIGDEFGEVIKDDIWPNPLQYFLASDLDEDEENEDELDEDEEALDEEDNDEENGDELN